MNTEALRRFLNEAQNCVELRCIPVRTPILKKARKVGWGCSRSAWGVINKFTISARDYQVLKSCLASILSEVERIEKQHHEEIEELEEMIDG